MKTIYSSDNRIFKLLRELSVKKYRDRSGKYIIEGENLIEEAVKSGIRPELIVVREDYEGKANAFLDEAEETVFMSRQLFEKVAQTETSQGIMAVVEKKVYTPDEFYEIVGDGNVVFLDRLQDPGNIGTVIRTAEAAGYKGVISLKGTGDIYSPKTVRATTGSVFRMPVLVVDDLVTATGRIKEAGKKLVATCMDGSVVYYEADLTKDIVLIIGNEGNGISDELQELSDIRVNIPMMGKVESLNASIAAAILMYEAQRSK
ncbi:MAG: RNA methyltransferase [Firmicutes bacterium]|nr:RNA methyltransferase [Bacillota bacterium]